MQIIVFEDDQVSRLYPITLGRPAYAMTCGSYPADRLAARLAAETGATLRSVVRPHLAAIQQLDFPQIDRQPPTTETPALLVNARLVPTVAALSHALRS